MGDIVIVAYRPKADQAQALLALAQEHVAHLRRLGLATNRTSSLLQARDGVIIEIFEWAAGGIAAAHSHPEVQKIWHAFGKVCDYVPLSALPEGAELFAAFKPIE